MKIHDYAILNIAIKITAGLAIALLINGVSTQIKANSSIIKYKLESQKEYSLDAYDEQSY